jgi:hypothetical protein
MILGESHYGEDDPDLTNTVLREHLEGTGRRPFFSRIASMLTGKAASECDQPAVFEKVAFYNYVQRLLPTCRVAPDQDDFDASECAFREALLCLKPHRIIALGWRLYRGTPAVWADGSRAWTSLGTLEAAGKKIAVGKFHLGNFEVQTGFVNHPSSFGFSPKAWHPVTKRFVANNGPRFPGDQ